MTEPVAVHEAVNPAMRIKAEGDLIAAFEVTNDLDWVTGPEAE